MSETTEFLRARSEDPTEPIPSRDAYDRWMDDVCGKALDISEARELGGWKMQEVHGCVSWVHANSQIIIHATPYWEGSKGIALQVDSYDGSVQEFPADLPYEETYDADADAARYVTTMNAFLSGWVAARLVLGAW